MVANIDKLHCLWIGAHAFSNTLLLHIALVIPNWMYVYLRIRMFIHVPLISYVAWYCDVYTWYHRMVSTIDPPYWPVMNFYMYLNTFVSPSYASTSVYTCTHRYPHITSIRSRIVFQTWLSMLPKQLTEPLAYVYVLVVMCLCVCVNCVHVVVAGICAEFPAALIMCLSQHARARPRHVSLPGHGGLHASWCRVWSCLWPQ